LIDICAFQEPVGVIEPKSKLEYCRAT